MKFLSQKFPYNGLRRKLDNTNDILEDHEGWRCMISIIIDKLYSYILMSCDVMFHLCFLGVIWMHVIEYEGVQGGATILTDGFKVAEHIRNHEPVYFDLLSKVSLPYQMIFKDEAAYKMRRHTFTVDDDNEMSAIYLNNLDRKPLDETSISEAREVLSCDTDEAIAKMYKALRCFHQTLLCDDQFAYKFRLQPGRMMLIDNHRLLHAREEVLAGFRGMCGLQISESEWQSKMKMLEWKLNIN